MITKRTMEINFRKLTKEDKERIDKALDNLNKSIRNYKKIIKNINIKKEYCQRHDYDFKINGEDECKYCKEEYEQDNAYEISIGK